MWRIPLEVQRAAMGIDWMTLTELSQAIPPAYTEHIGPPDPRRQSRLQGIRDTYLTIDASPMLRPWA